MEYVYLLYNICHMFGRMAIAFSQEFTQIGIAIPSVVEYSVRNQELHNVLLWTKESLEQFEKIPLSSRVSSLNIHVAADVLRRIISHKICIPRYFFQQTHSTDIKLHILPEPRENQTSVVPTSKRFPVTVEGYIVSNNKAKIESLFITASLRFEKDKFNYEQENKLTVKDGKYFKTQFLLDIYTSGKINFSVKFVDKSSKRVWSSDCTAQMNVAFAG
uniref:WIF domain-containing protein n=1 Tax=Steinernema glaseri TaxID=37863 RepID=A0A1I8AJ09_9BILA